MRLVIRSGDDLSRAAQLVSFLRRPYVDQLTLALAPLTDLERLRLARILRRLFNDCGCTWAGVACVGAVAGLAIVRPWVASPSQRGIWLYVAAAVVVTAGAKFAALAWSWLRLARLMDQLAALVREDDCHGHGLHRYPGMDRGRGIEAGRGVGGAAGKEV